MLGDEPPDRVELLTLYVALFQLLLDIAQALSP
ncbi:hypothetical protein SAMN05216511_7228 [Streptomyces sp. KS_16]|nr:hypothetical protein BX261_7341 [Streptomyces sp. 2321.6]SDR61946.1 hypothetical protein SAMN05216511_7228 [Streptomyces sp. KS_16]SEE49058.1 hypothetical protein SAMN05428940_7277 [Streptomyces sp. 2133.1]SNC77762.1 hypothetical protein SAMN06272741_7178 [Streptomyces sp. 2114.4]